MFICEVILLCIVAFIICLISLIFIDCDISLAFKMTFGKKIEKLADKVIWISGASSGIGEELAVVLASVGAKLILSSRRRNELERVKERCINKSKGKLSDADILVLPFDVLEFNAHKEMVDTIMEHFGHIDILVNNAGRSQRGYFVNTDLEVHRQMMELNVLAPMSLTKHVLPSMIKAGGGQIVNISSMASLVPVCNSATYAATKAALNAFSQCLRLEHNKDNIRVSVVCPGPVFSDFLQNSFTEVSGQAHGKAVDAKDKRMRTDRCAYLIAVATVNQVWDSWLASTFFLRLTFYLATYAPTFTKRITLIMGKRIETLRDGK